MNNLRQVLGGKARRTKPLTGLFSLMASESFSGEPGIKNGLFVNHVKNRVYHLEPCLSTIEDAMFKQGQNIPDNLGFELSSSRAFNARILSTEEGFLCQVNQGVLDITHLLCIILLNFQEKKSCNKKQHLQDCAIAFIQTVHKYLHGKHWRFYQLMHSLNKSCQDQELTRLNFAIKSFILAHEIGHIVLGHMGSMDNHLIKFPADENAFDRSLQNEFESDLFALTTMLEIDNNNSLPFKIADGALVFFLIYQIIMTIESKLKKQGKIAESIALSHPSNIERANAMKTRMQQLGINPGSQNDYLLCVLELIEQCTINQNRFGYTILTRK